MVLWYLAIYVVVHNIVLFLTVFCTERLIVAEEFYSENLKTALKSGKAFR